MQTKIELETSRADHVRVVVVVAAADVVDVGGGRLGERARDDDAGVAPVLEVRRSRPRHAEPGVIRRRHPRRHHAKRHRRYSSMLHKTDKERERESLHYSFTLMKPRERIVLGNSKKSSVNSPRRRRAAARRWRRR